MFWIYEYVYRIKGGGRFKFTCLAREDKTADEMIRLVTLLVPEYPPTKLLKKKKVWVDFPPYEIEQNYINNLRKKLLDRGIDPDK